MPASEWKQVVKQFLKETIMSESKPLVSIIVPIYNGEKVIRKCIESILNQDYQNFELLLMDDGSKDGSPAICDEYAASDSRVTVVHKANSGVSDTRNQAMAMAKGEYFQFLDADDWIVPEATKLLVRAMEENDVDLVVADFYRVVGENTSRKGSIDKSGVYTKLQFADCMMASPADYYYGVIWNKLFKGDIIRSNMMKMDKTLNWCEDFIFNMEYILHTENIYVLKVPIYYYVKTEGSLVSQGLNTANVVRMKLNVVEYYRAFYKNLLSETEYERRKTEINAFLIDYAHDDGAPGFLPSTKKLGTERSVSVQKTDKVNMWTTYYYLRKVMEREMANVSLQFKLSKKELRVITYLHMFGRIESKEELAEYVETSWPMIATIIEQLRLKGYVRLERGRPITATLTEKAGEIVRILDRTMQDMKNNLIESLSEEFRTFYEEFESIVNDKLALFSRR